MSPSRPSEAPCYWQPPPSLRSTPTSRAMRTVMPPWPPYVPKVWRGSCRCGLLP
ncbi:hypothetical protein BAE44_0017638 [Dichanthelium oligosanthes]|uniref:Uncharacterized protein n=1 Tax=Dichanthelium oligosanthes TaxID=888268 RepID=A0A1E5V871_9POAL|nr:hypothetical protein BAE44_0017638 [Dichanthelium oligosanthes]